MDTLDKITILLQEQNKTQSDLCAYIGVKKNAYTNWKSGHTTSYKKYLPQIAEYFNVSVDYLVGKTEQKNRADPEGPLLTENQQKLYDVSSDLSNEDIEKVIDYIELLKLKNNAQQKERIKLVARSGEQKEIETSQEDIDKITSSLNEDTTSDF